MVETAEDIDPLDRSGPDDSTSYRDRAFGLRGGAHRQVVQRELHVTSSRPASLENSSVTGKQSVATSRMSSTSACDERWSEARSLRNMTLRSPLPGVMPDHSYPTKITHRPSS